jgi:hypothetical protein
VSIAHLVCGVDTLGNHKGIKGGMMKMKNMGQGLRSLCVAAALLFAGFAQAGYVNCGGDDHDHDHGFETSDFTYFPTPTAWDPGANTARIGGFPAAGGATWSIMGAGLGDVSGFDPHSGATTTTLGSLYAGGALDEASALDAVFNQWAAVSGFTNLGQVADGNGGFGGFGAAGNTGDIRVGSVFMDGAVGGNVLAHAYQPSDVALAGPGGSIGGDMHFDNSNAWSDGGGGGTIDFFTVALHELGHALGLGHSTVVGSVMEAFYGGPRRTLHADDIAGIQSIYGLNNTVPPVPEPATMTLLGIGLAGLAYRRRRQA